MNTSPTTEERVWAVFSHLSAIALGIGILLPIIGWSEQRRKSKYASFQCLQAFGYQSLGYTVWLLSYLVVFIGILLVIIVMSFRAEKSGQQFDPLAGPVAVLIFMTIFGYLALYLLLPIIAAIACALGKDFRYPMMGDRLAKYLGYQQTADESAWLIEPHEDRWVAAMGHFSVIILSWGLIAPLTVWITQGKRNLFLKFQSIQTFVYQVGVTILYFVAMFVYLFGFVAFIASTEFAGSTESVPPTRMLSFGLIIFGVFILVASAIFLVIPLFHILGQWAGYRILKGEDYHYPVIGKLVERWIAKSSITKEKTL